MCAGRGFVSKCFWKPRNATRPRERCAVHKPAYEKLDDAIEDIAASGEVFMAGLLLRGFEMPIGRAGSDLRENHWGCGRKEFSKQIANGKRK